MNVHELAAKMTLDRYKKEDEIRKKLEAIKEYNREHPVPPVVVVYESEPDPLDSMEIVKASARWIGKYHAGILGGFGFGSTKK